MLHLNIRNSRNKTQPELVRFLPNILLSALDRWLRLADIRGAICELTQWPAEKFLAAFWHPPFALIWLTLSVVGSWWAPLCAFALLLFNCPCCEKIELIERAGANAWGMAAEAFNSSIECESELFKRSWIFLLTTGISCFASPELFTIVSCSMSWDLKYKINQHSTTTKRSIDSYNSDQKKQEN